MAKKPSGKKKGAGGKKKGKEQPIVSKKKGKQAGVTGMATDQFCKLEYESPNLFTSSNYTEISLAQRK